MVLYIELDITSVVRRMPKLIFSVIRGLFWLVISPPLCSWTLLVPDTKFFLSLYRICQPRFLFSSPFSDRERETTHDEDNAPVEKCIHRGSNPRLWKTTNLPTKKLLRRQNTLPGGVYSDGPSPGLCAMGSFFFINAIFDVMRVHEKKQRQKNRRDARKTACASEVKKMLRANYICVIALFRFIYFHAHSNIINFIPLNKLFLIKIKIKNINLNCVNYPGIARSISAIFFMYCKIEKKNNYRFSIWQKQTCYSQD